MGLKRILMITQIPLWSMGKRVGGPALFQTLEGFSRRGIKTDLVCQELDYVDKDDLPENVTLHTFPHRFDGILKQVRKIGWFFDSAGWFAFQRSAYVVARETARKAIPDLFYGYEIYGVPVARRLGDEFGRPVVARYQGTIMSYRMDWPFARIRFFKHFSALRTRADLYIMTDDGRLGDKVLESLGAEKERIRFWRNGVFKQFAASDRNRAKERFGLNGETRVLVAASRLDNWKRIDRAIRVMPCILAKVPDTVLLVAGEGVLRGELEAQARAFDVAENVRFLGGLPHHEVAEVMAAGDVFLSLYDQSNVANPVFEAMQSELPVVTLNVGTTGQLIRHGETGWLLEPDDDEALCDHVVKLLLDDKLRRRMGKTAKEFVDREFWTWEQRLSAEVEELEKLIADGAHRDHST